jgi:ARG/rhodanese/phosphatase superfamily protein
MRRGLLMHLVALCFASLSLGLSTLAGAGTQVSGPVAHDNLAVYFVHGSAAQGAVPMTLEEALAMGRVKVSEIGSVNELTVENVGDDEVFVQAGDIVKGGRQDRVLSVDLLLPPHSGRVFIAAFCVEPGRWSARGQEDPRQFSTSAAAMPSHEAKLAIQSYVAEHVGAVPCPESMPRPVRRKSGRRCEKRRSSFRARSAHQWPPPPRRRACNSRSRTQSSGRRRPPTSTHSEALRNRPMISSAMFLPSTVR